jgi:hypothetical protein
VLGLCTDTPDPFEMAPGLFITFFQSGVFSFLIPQDSKSVTVLSGFDFFKAVVSYSWAVFFGFFFDKNNKEKWLCSCV